MHFVNFCKNALDASIFCSRVQIYNTDCNPEGMDQIRSHKEEVRKQEKSRFFLLFLLDDIRIRIHTFDQWIRIWEAQELSDPMDTGRTRNTGKDAFLSVPVIT
jgi:hypothetical protein